MTSTRLTFISWQINIGAVLSSHYYYYSFAQNNGNATNESTIVRARESFLFSFLLSKFNFINSLFSFVPRLGLNNRSASHRARAHTHTRSPIDCVVHFVHARIPYSHKIIIIVVVVGAFIPCEKSMRVAATIRASRKNLISRDFIRANVHRAYMLNG